MAVQVSPRPAEHLYSLAVGRAARHRRRPLHLGRRRVDIALANDAAERCLDMTGRTAEAVVKIEMPERGIEIVAPEQAHHPPAEPKALRIGGGASQELLGFGKFVDLLRR